MKENKSVPAKTKKAPLVRKSKSISPPKTDMSATQAVRQLYAEYGHVVVGYNPGATTVEVGQRLDEFGRSPLRGCYLEVIGIASRAEWEEQVINLFGNPRRDVSPPKIGQWFIKAKLVDEA
jgi:hypothetical protein